jgi:hypothetical protein
VQPVAEAVAEACVRFNQQERGGRAMKVTFASVMTASVLMLVSMQAASADWTGKAFYKPVSEETLKLSDGRVLIRSVVAGYVYATSPGNPFDMLYQTCSSTILVTPDGGGTEQFGHCDALDADQNLFAITFHDAKWRIEGGTGKFAGMKGGGTTTNVHAWPDGSYLITWEGTAEK